MSAKAYIPDSPPAPLAGAGSSGPLPVTLAFWTRFQTEAEARVRECNTLAGERLWEVKGRKEATFRLAVGSTTCPEDYVECVFDPATGILACTPGPALAAGRCEFRMAGDGRALCVGNSEYTTCEALALILDELVFVHGDC